MLIFCCVAILSLGVQVDGQQIFAANRQTEEIAENNIGAQAPQQDNHEIDIEGQDEENEQHVAGVEGEELEARSVMESDEEIIQREKKKQLNEEMALSLETFEPAQGEQDIIRNGPYTFYLNKDKTIKYASYSNGKHIEKYYQYVAGTKYQDVSHNRIAYIAYMYTNGTIAHVREYNKGYWTKAFRFPPRTKINQNKKYWQGRTYTFYMKPNRKDGLLERGARFTAANKADIYYQYVAGTKYPNYSEKKINYRAFVNPNGTIKHVREYKNGNWFKAFEFPKNKKINHKKKYWEGRTHTFYMQANRKDGLLTHSIKFSGKKAIAKYTYQPKTFYGKGHSKRIKRPSIKWVKPVKKGVVICILERCVDGHYGGRHNGVDIANNGGASVYSMAAGKVTTSKYFGNLGHMIGVHYHVSGKDYYIIYAHLSTRKVRAGQKVKMGQVIGNVGGSGGPYVAHLHIEVLKGVKSFIASGPDRRKKAISLNELIPIRLNQRLG